MLQVLQQGPVPHLNRTESEQLRKEIDSLLIYNLMHFGSNGYEDELLNLADGGGRLTRMYWEYIRHLL